MAFMYRAMIRFSEKQSIGRDVARLKIEKASSLEEVRRHLGEQNWRKAELKALTLLRLDEVTASLEGYGKTRCYQEHLFNAQSISNGRLRHMKYSVEDDYGYFE
jgi:hypothetical protein